MNGVRKLYAGPKCPASSGSSRVSAMALENDVSQYGRLHMIRYDILHKIPHALHNSCLRYVPSVPPSLQYPIYFSPPLPVAFDWKKNLSPVKNQGMCSSCWAFASTTVMEAYISIQSKKPPVALSPQSMVDCNKDFSCVGYFCHTGTLRILCGLPAPPCTAWFAGDVKAGTAHSTPCIGLHKAACPPRRTTRTPSRPPLASVTRECQR